MRRRIRKILVTGGAGFIGSAFVRLLFNKRMEIVVADKLTYAADLARLKQAGGSYKFYKVDVADSRNIARVFEKERPEAVVNFAASTHVDRSILDARDFLRTNIIGTQVLLDAARKFDTVKFCHISTDEVYGDIINGQFREDCALKPNSPYAASKAAADLLIRSYVRTYGFPAIIVRPCNNYGLWQYPEKLIPLAVLKVLRGEKVPVYAKGKNVREWLFVEDCAGGIYRVLTTGRVGEVYNLGSSKRLQNIKVVSLILKVLGRDGSAIEFVRDRPGHDFRYSLDSGKVFQETGWRPKVSFAEGLPATVSWCLRNKKWLLSKWRNISPLYKR